MGLDIRIGMLEKGAKNNICDVEGVRVGHKTLSDGKIQTGVTAILPAPGSIFKNKLLAGASVLNGFGKSVGLVQVEELGTLESPIIMTNTLSVGTALTALTRYMLEENPEIGDTTGTVNCLVTECNDGLINDIRGLHVKEEDVFEALASAGEDFEEGALGAGRGMVAFDLKGGIGSSSRLLKLADKTFTVGALVLSNYGSASRLRIEGKKIFSSKDKTLDQGSVIIIIATDVPLSSRQLKRVSRRAVISLGRTGSIMGNGSGDIAISFSTANRLPHKSREALVSGVFLHEDYLEGVFEAAIDSVEEALYSSLYHSQAQLNRKGQLVHSLKEYWNG